MLTFSCRILEIFLEVGLGRASPLLCTYVHGCRSGRHLTDDEIAGMLIGLLLAGQHTSSTTSSWLGFFLAKHPDIQVVVVVVVAALVVVVTSS